jgi:hypothetical protein
VSAVAEAVRQADWALIDRARRAGSLSLETIATAAAEALAKPLHAAYHCLAYYMLVAIIKPLVEHDGESLCRSPPFFCYTHSTPHTHTGRHSALLFPPLLLFICAYSYFIIVIESSRVVSRTKQKNSTSLFFPWMS